MCEHRRKTGIPYISLLTHSLTHSHTHLSNHEFSHSFTGSSLKRTDECTPASTHITSCDVKSYGRSAYASCMVHLVSISCLDTCYDIPPPIPTSSARKQT